MKVSIKFWSYFKEYTQCAETTLDLEENATLGDAHSAVIDQFPALIEMKNSTLKAVGVEYKPDDLILSEGDEISFFPPVQGG